MFRGSGIRYILRAYLWQLWEHYRGAHMRPTRIWVGQVMKSELEKEIELKESFDQMLDDSFPDVKIGYSTFTASEILFNCDPIAYNIGLIEHEDYLNEMENE